MCDWQPIETAPTMEAVLICGGDVLYPFSASQSGIPEEGWWIDAQAELHGHDAAAFSPTHWMPLPTPPKEGTE